MAVEEDRQGAVATVTIARPEARNALDAATLEELIAAFTRLDADPEVRVLVLTGAGDKAFCAGADLRSGLTSDPSVLDGHEQRGLLRRLFASTEALRTPLIGRINGHALAGGLGVALACDLLVAVEDATFGTPEVRVGLWPHIISALLVQHLGPKRALEWMMTGRRYPAAEAERLGLVNQVVPRGQLDEAVAELADELIKGAPLALALGRRSYLDARSMEPGAAMAYLHGMLDLQVQTEDAAEGIAAFLERREPTWRGR
ncbi:MAG: enoyl-CoA hydratase/isomerase family protein [Nitriliruptoraceae bacterium]